MNFFVLGCGSIGERHIRNLRALYPEAKISAYDPNMERMRIITARYADIEIADFGQLEKTSFDCVLICTPPSTHIELASIAALAGSNLFIEKPLASTLDSAEKISNLRDIVDNKKLLAFVGYNFRFNHAVTEMKQIVKSEKLGRAYHASAYFGQYLPDWRPEIDYKQNYTSRRELGGGIIHDGSHEIDLLQWLFGKPVRIQSQVAFSDFIKANTEAVVDVLLKFENNLLGYIHMDFLRRQYKRRVEILFDKGIVEWCLSEKKIRIYDSTSTKWNEIILTEEINDMYIEELRHVTECIRSKQKSEIISLDNGISTFDLSQTVHESASLGKVLDVTMQSNPRQPPDLSQ
jgi:predicted dehydrogenase